MDRFSPALAAAVKKSSTRRIISQLILLGESEESVLEMDRATLMDTWARYLLKEKLPTEAAAAVEEKYDPVTGVMRMEQEKELRLTMCGG